MRRAQSTERVSWRLTGYEKLRRETRKGVLRSECRWPGGWGYPIRSNRLTRMRGSVRGDRRKPVPYRDDEVSRHTRVVFSGSNHRVRNQRVFSVSRRFT